MYYQELLKSEFFIFAKHIRCWIIEVKLLVIKQLTMANVRVSDEPVKDPGGNRLNKF